MQRIKNKFSGFQLKTALLIALVSWLFCGNVVAQLEYGKWWWQPNNMLDFTSGGAPVYGNGPGSQWTGAPNTQTDGASICDRNGNLLFACNTGEVFNRQGNVMPNGLLFPLNLSETHGEAVICPIPCNDSLYYIFRTVRYDQQGIDTFINGSFILVQTLVNINLDGGLGDVISNDTIDSLIMLSIDVCRHANNRDFWLVTEDVNYGQEFRTWQITDTGRVSNPVISNSGAPAFPLNTGNVYYGGLSISPNRSFIGITSRIIVNANLFDVMRLFEFNYASGAVNYFCELDFSTFPHNNFRMKINFSPKSTKIYVSNVLVYGNTT